MSICDTVVSDQDHKSSGLTGKAERGSNRRQLIRCDSQVQEAEETLQRKT